MCTIVGGGRHVPAREIHLDVIPRGMEEVAVHTMIMIIPTFSPLAVSQSVVFRNAIGNSSPAILLWQSAGGGHCGRRQRAQSFFFSL